MSTLSRPTLPRPARPGDSPRAVAWLALRAVEGPEGADAQGLLGALAQQAGLEPRDRALAFELMQGVLRERLLLDAALRSLEGFREASIEPALLDLLRLGAYQHFRLDRIPVHALVHATVEAARRELGERPGGFCNAALQQLVRQYPGRGADLEQFAATLALETRMSFPGWIVRLVKRTVGAENLEAALAALNRPLPLYGRANRLRATPREAADALAQAGVAARVRPDLAPLCLEIDGPAGAVVETEVFQCGGIILQDTSAQLVAELAGAAPGMTVIDYSAAPGGKTTALAAAMEKRGRLIACDVSETRMGRLGENLARMGLADFVEVRRIGEAGEGLEALREELGGAGLVLVDAPCSGLGTLRRHPEIRWRLRNADLARLAALQLAILERAATLVRPGGRLVYGTCSLAAEENEAVVEAFLQRHPGAFKILPPSEDLPPHLRSRLSASGWLRLLPQREEMDSASAVRLVRVR